MGYGENGYPVAIYLWLVRGVDADHPGISTVLARDDSFSLPEVHH